VKKETVWLPLWEYRTLKRKPKKIDFVLPIGYSYHFAKAFFPLNKWVYFAQGNNYWKIRIKGEVIK